MDRRQVWYELGLDLRYSSIQCVLGTVVHVIVIYTNRFYYYYYKNRLNIKVC